MTLREDTDSPEPKQADTLCLLLPLGLWLEMPDTWSNRRGVMIWLRSLRRADGWPLRTYEHIAQALGDADRRNGHNFGAEFEACGADLGAFLPRRKKVDAEVVAGCEQIWKAPPLWSCAPVHAELMRRWPAQAVRLTEQNIRTAGQQVGCWGVQRSLRQQLVEGQVHSQEPVLLEHLFELAQAQASETLPAHPIPNVLEAIRPQGPAPQLSTPTEAAPVAALEAVLLHGEATPARWAQVWQGTTGAMLLAFLLYYHGVSLEVIGRFFGVHKTTVMRWFTPLAQVHWQAAGQQGRRFF